MVFWRDECNIQLDLAGGLAGGLSAVELDCTDTLNPNAVFVGAAALAVGAGALLRAVQVDRERRQGEDFSLPYLDTLSQAVTKYS